MPFTYLDVILGLVFVFVTVYSLTQGVLRQLISLGLLYLTTAVVGSLYPVAAYYVQAFGPNSPTLRQAIVFVVLMVLINVLLELLLRRWFPDTRLLRLGALDRILAVGPGILCGLIIVSLLMSAVGYATVESWGDRPAPAQTALARTVRGSLSYPLLGQFMQLYLTAHQPWLPSPPPLLAYLLPDGS
jgi:uncharacterized membrane protein required for colicin V production